MKKKAIMMWVNHKGVMQILYSDGSMKKREVNDEPKKMRRM
jgi:hypothetical protein